jgi:hypothetical protein
MHLRLYDDMIDHRPRFGHAYRSPGYLNHGLLGDTVCTIRIVNANRIKFMLLQAANAVSACTIAVVDSIRLNRLGRLPLTFGLLSIPLFPIGLCYLTLGVTRRKSTPTRPAVTSMSSGFCLGIKIPAPLTPITARRIKSHKIKFLQTIPRI